MVRSRVWRLAVAVVIAAAAVPLVLASAAEGQATVQQAFPSTNLAPFVPTPLDVVKRMLKLAGVTKRDVVYDLGCGDGRIVIAAAATYGARGVGFDINPDRIKESEENAKKAGVEKLVTFKLQDVLTADVSRATVVTLYLLSSSNAKLRPILTKQLKPGARIVSHAFDMGDWEAAKVERFDDEMGVSRTLFLWKADGVVRQ